MKTILAITAVVAVTATAAAAQDTTQAGVLGESGDATYTLEVQGANGVMYNCLPSIETIDGVSARRCVTQGSGLANAGNGLTSVPAVAAGLAAVVAIALVSDSSTSTTTTTGSP